MSDRRLRTIRDFATEYKLDLGGVKVWAPYWINWDEPPYWKNAPYRGKGGAAQIQTVARRYLARLPQQSSDPEEIRVLLKQAGLGVDCSGFVYQVLNRF